MVKRKRLHVIWHEVLFAPKKLPNRQHLQKNAFRFPGTDKTFDKMTETRSSASVPLGLLKLDSRFKIAMNELMTPVILSIDEVPGLTYRIVGGKAYAKILGMRGVLGMLNPRIPEYIHSFDWNVVLIPEEGSEEGDTSGIYSSGLDKVLEKLRMKLDGTKLYQHLSDIASNYGIDLGDVAAEAEEVKGTQKTTFYFKTSEGHLHFMTVVDGTRGEETVGSLNSKCGAWYKNHDGLKFIGLCDIFHKFIHIFGKSDSHNTFKEKMDKTFMRMLLVVNCAMLGKLNKHYYSALGAVAVLYPDVYAEYLQNTVMTYRKLRDLVCASPLSKSLKTFNISMHKSENDLKKGKLSFEIHWGVDPVADGDSPDSIMAHHNKAVFCGKGMALSSAVRKLKHLDAKPEEAKGTLSVTVFGCSTQPPSEGSEETGETEETEGGEGSEETEGGAAEESEATEATEAEATEATEAEATEATEAEATEATEATETEATETEATEAEATEAEAEPEQNDESAEEATEEKESGQTVGGVTEALAQIVENMKKLAPELTADEAEDSEEEESEEEAEEDSEEEDE